MKQRLAALGLMALACLTLALSYELKKPCLEVPWGEPLHLEYRDLCYNDIQGLYDVRGLDRRAFPYVVEKGYEYPVVLGLAMWFTSNFASDYNEYFRANVPLLAFAALLAVASLLAATGPVPQLLWFCAGTPLLFYAYLNWDLLAVASVALAIWAFSRGRDGWAGAAIGLGISAKIYPVFLLPSLVLERCRREGSLSLRQAPVRRLLGGVVAAWLSLNLPIICAELLRDGRIDGWWGVFTFHALRSPDFGTPWYWLPELVSPGRFAPAFLRLAPVLLLGWLTLGATLFTAQRARQGRTGHSATRVVSGAGILATLLVCWVMSSPALGDGVTSDSYRHLVDLVSFVGFTLGAAGLLFAQWRRGRGAWPTAGAILALYLALSKIHSPQHALWMLPFLAVVTAPWQLVLCYLVSDALTFVGVFSWFGTSPGQEVNFWAILFAIGVFLRASSLLALLGWFAWKGRDLTLPAGGDAYAGREELRGPALIGAEGRGVTEDQVGMAS